jgi:hypothetical protein
MKQVYVIPQDCVEHLIEDGIFTDREKVKRIGAKCGEILSPIDYEIGVNNGDIDLNESLILID